MRILKPALQSCPLPSRHPPAPPCSAGAQVKAGAAHAYKGDVAAAVEALGAVLEVR